MKMVYAILHLKDQESIVGGFDLGKLIAKSELVEVQSPLCKNGTIEHESKLINYSEITRVNIISV